MDELIYNLSYRDILLLPYELKDKVINRFIKFLNDIPKCIYRNDKTLNEMLLEKEFLIQSKISHYVFSGSIVDYYPNIKFKKVLKPFTCPISGEFMSVGSEEVIWNPLFCLPESGDLYSLEKAIRVNYYYYYYSDFFPTDVLSLDDFFFKVENSYELNLDDYYNFFCNTGGLKLRKFK